MNGDLSDGARVVEVWGPTWRLEYNNEFGWLVVRAGWTKDWHANLADAIRAARGE